MIAWEALAPVTRQVVADGQISWENEVGAGAGLASRVQLRTDPSPLAGTAGLPEVTISPATPPTVPAPMAIQARAAGHATWERLVRVKPDGGLLSTHVPAAGAPPAP